MDDAAIRVAGLSKRYRLHASRRTSLLPRKKETLWALRDVNFDVGEGEILGVVGANGAGKTTLLRVLAKITSPTMGRAEIYGRVGSLLEVGTGFHPELTGRENVFLNGAILGMGRREIARKYEDIVAFSEVDGFMETPVKHYSSGMRVRLAFSVAAYLESEILFIDEVLAVGDAGFQQKCLGKVEEVANAGRTVLVVSHNMGMITSLCTRAIWIDGGRIRTEGAPQDVVEAYLSRSYVSDGVWRHPVDAACGAQMRITEASVLDADGVPRPAVAFEDPLRIQVEHEVFTAIEHVAVVVRLTDALGNVILVSQDIDMDSSRGSWEPGRYRYTVTVPGALLRPGRYFIGVQGKKRRGVKLDAHDNCLAVEVLPIRFRAQPNRPGVITPMLPWEWERLSALETT